MVHDPTGSLENRSGPGPEEARDHPTSKALAKASSNPPSKGGSAVLIVRQSRRRGGDAGKRGLPVAHASQAAPCASRMLWHVMYQCGACGGTHFGRSPVELTTGERLARCGRMVWLVIARTYRGRSDSGAAA